MEKSQKSAPKSPAQREICLRLENKSGVVELQLSQRVAHEIVVVPFFRIKAGVDYGFYFFVARKPRDLRFCACDGYRITHPAILDSLETGGDITDVSRGQRAGFHEIWRKIANFNHQAFFLGGHSGYFVFCFNFSVD